jgi:hypothetical protein
MVPVITAIVAAVLAGGVAIYRERRIELWKLVVAARVLLASLQDAFLLLEVLRDESFDVRWERFLERDDWSGIEAVWSQHRETLAAGLSRSQWNQVVFGVEAYFGAMRQAADRGRASHEDERDRFVRAQKHVKLASNVLGAYSERPGVLHNPGRRADAERAPS